MTMHHLSFSLWLFASLLLPLVSHAQTPPVVGWDARSLTVDGRRVVPVMGEIHYSRLPADEWPTAIRRMREGGVTMIATYVFWNHVEEVEGQYDWSGQRDLRRFLECCQAECMPVVLRIGPFCHGEVRCGGIPDWALRRVRKTRVESDEWLALVTRLYRQVFTQVQGLQWKDGGPVVGCQFDNEYRGRASYLLALKRIATGIGFDVPLYTRTGWPELSTPVPYGELLPLYGDYADGFWERSLKPAAGNYWRAFFFQPSRDHQAIATDQLAYSDSTAPAPEQAYPYFTCELGGGMMTAYHRRPYMYADDAYALAVVKIGSGSNLLGYYMYHGGTNPDGKLTTLNENQRTPATNHNDMPVKTYDFQAPLGEFGQRGDTYYRLRPLHLFMSDFGELLAPMDARFPATPAPRQGDDGYLRYSLRLSPDGRSGFVFFNNYERLQRLTDKRSVRFAGAPAGGFPHALTIPAGAIGVLPVGVCGLRWATAQLVARRDGKVYLMQIDGMPADVAFDDGRVMRHVKPRGLDRPIHKNYYLLTRREAERLFLPDEALVAPQKVAYTKVKAAGPLRTIAKGVQGVAMEPTDADFLQAAVYEVDLPTDRRCLLDIDYRGDCARLYADGKLVADNFYNGRHFQYGLWRLPEGVTRLELRILPLQPDEPVYFPQEADTTPGEAVRAMTLLQR